MKTINQIFGACMLFTTVILPIKTFAQDNVKKSLNDFITSDDAKFTNKISEIKDPKTNRLLSMCNVYKFSIPPKINPMDIFESIYNAFEKDHDMAYWTLRQDANSPQKETNNMIYGDDGNYITIGVSANQNVLAMNVVDKIDSTHRYSYILEWMKDEKTHNTIGDVIFLYGKIPQKNISKQESLNPQNLSEIKEFYLQDKNHLKYNIEGDSLFFEENGKKQYVLIPNLNYDKFENTIKMRNYDIDGNNENDKTTVGWLSKFNVLKNMYSGNESSLSSSIVARMVDLCKRSKNMLNIREKSLCIESIQEMKQKTKDKFQKGLLDEAIDYLK
jgi:hypothetical protein